MGKVQLALTPVVNHFWNVTLHVTARGLATSALHYAHGTFDIELDLVGHEVVIRTSTGDVRRLQMRPRAVADFYRELFSLLASLGIDVQIWDHPVELKTEPIPFHEDRMHDAYDRDYVERFFHVVSAAAEMLDAFRSRFLGKCSGVGFYWGTFDLSVARYCGRRAPDPPTSLIEREGYSHEVSEAGFWPGDAIYSAPGFYALHYPIPEGYTRATVRPVEARWQEQNHCFVLPYDACRSDDATSKVLEFCQSTYEAGADLAHWDRAELERQGEPYGR